MATKQENAERGYFVDKSVHRKKQIVKLFKQTSDYTHPGKLTEIKVKVAQSKYREATIDFEQICKDMIDDGEPMGSVLQYNYARYGKENTLETLFQYVLSSRDIYARVDKYEKEVAGDVKTKSMDEFLTSDSKQLKDAVFIYKGRQIKQVGVLMKKTDTIVIKYRDVKTGRFTRGPKK